jgi:hypothetical protein
VFTMPSRMGTKHAVTKSKRNQAIGARLNEEEAALWNELLRRTTERNTLAKASDVLRDVLFGGLNLVTEEDKQILREHRFPVPIVEANQNDKGKTGGKKKQRTG